MIDFLLGSAPLLYAGVFVFGALIGSFLNVIVLRLPPMLEHEWRSQCRELLELDQDASDRPPGIVLSRSRCPKCGHPIAAWENVPIISYLALGGKCSNCKTRISFRYPLIEFSTAVLFTVTIWHFGPNIQGATALLLTAYLIVMAAIDIDHQLLPDNLTLPLLWAGLLLNLGAIHSDLPSAVIGAIAGYIALWSVYQLFRLLTGKEGMGYGDFKLLAALGAWIGWQLLPMIVLLSSLAGAVLGLLLLSTGRLKRDKPMPFGPFIAAAGWIALIWGRDVLDFYAGSGTFG